MPRFFHTADGNRLDWVKRIKKRRHDRRRCQCLKLLVKSLVELLATTVGAKTQCEQTEKCNT